MYLTTLIARDIPDAWFQVLDRIWNTGETFTVERGSYEGQQRRQLDHLTLRITHPFTKPLLPEMPPHLSHVPPPADDDYLSEYVSYLMTDALTDGESYTYGERLFAEVDFKGHTPMGYLISMLQDNRYTNQATLSISQPSDIALEDPPCLRSISFRYIQKELHMFVNFRSWDAFGGLPVNLAGLTYLFEYVCSETGLKAGEIVATSEGIHCYDYVFDVVKSLVV